MLICGLLSFTFAAGQSQTHFKFTANTGSFYSIVVEKATANGSGLAIGDEIGVFTASGLCAGAVTLLQTTNIALAAWQDDPQTPAIDGFKPGEAMLFKVWKASADSELIAKPQYASGDGTFGNGPFAIITLLEGLTNHAPVVDLPEGLTFNEDGTATLALAAFAKDLNHRAEDLTWRFAGNKKLQIQIDARTHVAQFSAAANWFGAEKIALTAQDPLGATGTDSLTVTVRPVNDPPGDFVRVSPKDSLTLAPIPIAFRWSASPNVDSDTITYTLTIDVEGVANQFMLRDTAQVIDFSKIKLPHNPATVFWSVQAADGQFTKPASNGRGLIKIDSLLVGVQESPSQPQAYALLQNYPNPFWSGAASRLAGNPGTVLHFALPKPDLVRLVIYDAAGRKVRTLANAHYGTGYHSRYWDGRDDAGQLVASGIYLYRLQTANFTQTKKMILAR
jgi:hypothetical protein